MLKSFDLENTKCILRPIFTLFMYKGIRKKAHGLSNQPHTKQLLQ